MIHDQQIPSQSLELQQNILQINKYQPNFKCPNKYQAVYMCINKSCTNQSTFACQQKNCNCLHLHKKCLKANIEYITEQLQSKILDTKQIKSSIQQSFDTIINQISQYRDNLFTLIQELKYQPLSEIGKQFLLAIQHQKEYHLITSLQSLNLWEIINNTQTKISIFDQVLNQIQNFQQKEILNLYNSVENFNNLCTDFQINQKYYLTFLQKISTLQKIKQKEAILSLSSIITNLQQAKIFLNLFDNQIFHIKLLFKASEYDFELQKYFQICGKQQNTVILCKTNKDKIIGGYTPYCHLFQGIGTLTERGNEFIKDTQRKSFVFSLTNNEKFQIGQDQNCITRYKDNKYIHFGMRQFAIRDRSNVENCQSWFQNPNYEVGSYRKNDEQSFMKFTGNSTMNFTTKQWQVWKIQYKEINNE